MDPNELDSEYLRCRPGAGAATDVVVRGVDRAHGKLLAAGVQHGVGVGQHLLVPAARVAEPGAHVDLAVVHDGPDSGAVDRRAARATGLDLDLDGRCRSNRAIAMRPRLPAGYPRPRMKSYHLTTFGCQMNEHDSERMKGMLESLGYAEAPERDGADLILFNTCSIREKADNRLVGHLGEAKRLKARGPEPGRSASAAAGRSR